MTNIREVSKLAGVSVASVSRTLGNPEKVSEKTRKKVFDAIAKSGYRPNLLARNFRTRKTYMIVVLVPDIANPFFARVIRGIEQTAQRKGYSVLLGDTQGNIDREFFYANMIMTRQADGLIQLSARMPFNGGYPELTSPLPMVNACECLTDPDIPRVQLDNVAAAKTMTEHLLSLGHQKIGVILGPESSPLTQERLLGYKSALKEAGISFLDSLIAAGDFTMESGRKAAGTLLSSGQKPSAIFCFNDEMAIGAVQRVKSAGLSTPKDISIAGFDDINFSAFCDPPLTTIAQPTEEFGFTAMTILYEILQGNMPENNQHILPFELIIRKSTGPAPQ